MKRMKLAALAAVLCLLAGTTAQAEESAYGAVIPSSEGVTATVETADGSTIENAEVKIGYTSYAPTDTSVSWVDDAAAAEALGVELNDLKGTIGNYRFEMDAFLMTGAKVTLKSSIEYTFAMVGVTSDSKVVVYHWDVDGTRTTLPATAGDGTITITFESLSPVQILVYTPEPEEGGEPAQEQEQEPETDSAPSSDPAPAPTATPTAATAPKTAEGYELYMAAAIAAAALAGMTVCVKKARD